MRRRPLASLLSSLVLALPAAPASTAQEQDAQNRLAGESSPYLKEHAHDPVRWFPWGDEALALAKKEAKPLFLSFGYSACHWCHVMQKESFRNPEIAGILNRAFVAVKIDREERPDVDRVYMSACQGLSPSGCGWPLSVFATPAGAPFWVGTYLPPDDPAPGSGGGRGFRSLLLEIERRWSEDREDLVARGTKIREWLAESAKVSPSEEVPDRGLVATALEACHAREDRAHGGLGTAPKFPSPCIALLEMHGAARSGKTEDAAPTRRLLEALLAGGIRDHVLGGFHRYATDAAWRIPHFEKMLYDQALLATVFALAGRMFDEPRYAAAAAEILDFCARDMAAPGGGYVAALDADTAGVEGATYTWTLEQLRAALDADELTTLMAWSGATAQGDLEGGRNVLHAAKSVADVAAETGATPAAVRRLLESALSRLRGARSSRPQPNRDTKVLAGWNALMVSALARAAATAATPADADRFARRAAECAAFLESRLLGPEDRVLRAFADGKARHPGELSDHGALLNAFLDLHALRLEPAWLDRAWRIAAAIERDFLRDGGRLVDSAAADVLFETHDVFDGAWPSGTSLAILGWTRLGIVAGDERLLDLARGALRGVGRRLAVQPADSPMLMIAVDLLAGPSPRVEYRGAGDDRGLGALRAVVRERALPFVFESLGPPLGEGAPLVASVCVRNRCLEPARDADQLRERLSRALE